MPGIFSIECINSMVLSRVGGIADDILKRAEMQIHPFSALFGRERRWENSLSIDARYA